MPTRGRNSAAGIAAVLLVTGCGGDEPGAVPVPRDPVPVTVVRPSVSTAALPVPGTIRSVDRAELATRASGTVVRVPVDVGSVVSRGDVLLALDDADVSARIRGAEAELERAKRHLSRIEPLHADGAATGQELDDASARLRVAEAEVAAAMAQEAYAVLRAPFDGRVIAREVSPGDLAVPGRPVLVLAGSGALEVVADLPASLEGSVSVGDTLRMVDPAGGLDLPVIVARVAPALESRSRRFRVEAALPPDAARQGAIPGAYVRLEIPQLEVRTLAVPGTALVRRGQLTGVFTVTRDSAWIRWVRPGIDRGDVVEVLSGLEAGEAVVADPPPGLRDGAPVTVSGRGAE